MIRTYLCCLLAVSFCGCSDGTSTTSTTSSHFTLNVDGLENEWAESVSYQSSTETGSFPILTLDGVIFELRDPKSYQVNWDVLGVSGVKMN